MRLSGPHFSSFQAGRRSIMCPKTSEDREKVSMLVGDGYTILMQYSQTT